MSITSRERAQKPSRGDTSRAFVTDKRIYRRLPDNRMELVAVPNQPIEPRRAMRLGLIDAEGKESELTRRKDGTFALAEPERRAYRSSAVTATIEMDPATGLPVDHDRSAYGSTLDELTSDAKQARHNLKVDARKQASEDDAKDSTPKSGGAQRDPKK